MTLSATKIQNRGETVRLDLKIYSKEVVPLTQAVFADRADIQIKDEGKDAVAVVLRPKRPMDARERQALGGEFVNEVLNQDLRLGVVKSNSRVLQMLIASALQYAVGDCKRQAHQENAT